MYDQWLVSKVRAGEIDEAELLKRKAEILSRMKGDWRTVREHRGDVFVEQVPGGSRFYSMFGFIIEWRLRQLKPGN